MLAVGAMTAINLTLNQIVVTPTLNNIFQLKDPVQNFLLIVVSASVSGAVLFLFAAWFLARGKVVDYIKIGGLVVAACGFSLDLLAS
jgi:hypothetical protein